MSPTLFLALNPWAINSPSFGTHVLSWARLTPQHLDIHFNSWASQESLNIWTKWIFWLQLLNLASMDPYHPNQQLMEINHPPHSVHKQEKELLRNQASCRKHPWCKQNFPCGPEPVDKIIKHTNLKHWIWQAFRHNWTFQFMA